MIGLNKNVMKSEQERSHADGKCENYPRGATAEQKSQVIAEMTEVLAQGTAEKPGTTCDYRRGGNRKLGYRRRTGFRTAQAAGNLNIRDMRV